MKEILISISAVSVIVLVIFGILFGMTRIIKAQCLRSYSNFSPEWSVLTKCRIMVNGVLTPVDIVRELK
jgi:hypothetical protein